jgi:hypothetical protein
MRWTRERGALVPVVEDLIESDFLRNWEALDLRSERDCQRREWGRMMRDVLRSGQPTATVPGNAYTVVSPTFALSTTPKTALNLITGASNQPSIVEFGISCDGTTGNLLIELCQSTQAGAGTPGSTPTPNQLRGWPAQASANSCSISYTAEPTVLTTSGVKRWRFALPGGPLVMQAPLGRETTGIVTAATAGKGLCFRLTASTGTPNGDSYLEWEE